MAHAPALSGRESAEAGSGQAHVKHAPIVAARHPPVSPGKVAMWLFLATEVMFFTGLIGSYIVLRSGTPATAYSNFYAPGTDLTRLMDSKGLHLVDAGPNAARVVEILAREAKISESQAHHLAEQAPVDLLLGRSEADATALVDKLRAEGATAEVQALQTSNWPLPYDHSMNPLSIDLTAGNTFILICSSVTMVLALSAIQRGDKRKLSFYLLLTALIGASFLGVQVYEYYQLMFGHHYPIGISRGGHFRPDVSLFASCFFTMTGFHGAHVFGGVVMIVSILIGSWFGKFTKEKHSAVELVGLYWHFVDLVWILLFTVVYLI